MKDGVIADFDVTEKMLRYFLALIIENHVFKVKPRVIVCVPSGITEVEKRAVRDSALAPARRKSSWSPSHGGGDRCRSAGRDPTGNMVIDIGGEHRDRRYRALRHRQRHIDPHRRRRARHGDRAVHAQELQLLDR
jgi:rod shape-determining protein MreB